MRFFDKLTDRRRLVLTERLRRLPVWGHPGLRVSFQSEGTTGYAFGCRAGPSIQFSNLAHELAHAVQFGPERFKQRVNPDGSYHFQVNQVRVMGQSYDEPNTDQCTRREAETCAIERHLLELTGQRVHLGEFYRSRAGALSFLPDWWKFPNATRLQDITKLLDDYYSSWNKERVIDQLGVWLDLVEQRLRQKRYASRAVAADIEFTCQAERLAA